MTIWTEMAKLFLEKFFPGSRAASIRHTICSIKQKDLENLSTLTASIYGATVDFEWNDNTSALINDSKASNEAIKVATRLFGESNVITKRTPSLGGDDFAEYIKLIPGAYAYVGSGNPSKENTTVAHHDCHFDIDEDALYTSVKILCAYAIDYLNKDID